MKRAVVGAAAALLAVGLGVGALWLYGSTLPADSEIHLSVATRQGPAAVWQVVSDFEGQPAWNPEVVSVERVDDIAGKPAFRETDAAGAVRTLVTARWEAPHSIRRDIVEDGYLLGRWSLGLRPEGMGTRITLSEERRDPSPLGRVVQAATGADRAEGWDYLRALANHLGDGENQVTEVDAPTD